MSEVEYTKQQQNAIDARDCSIIVSAAAGSGKTAVLTERLAQLLADRSAGVKADRIIVVTFTTDAAAEMKNRLESKLTELINERPDDMYLLEQQVRLQNAKISTINSFCFELLRDNISDHEITSGFSVLSENDEKVIKSQAMDELLDWYSNEEYDKISYLYDCFCHKDQKPLVEIIRKTDEFLSSVAVDKIWFKKVIAEYEKDFEDTIYYSKFFDDIYEKTAKLLTEIEKNAENLKYIFKEKSECADKHMIQAQLDIARVQALLKIAKKRILPTDDEMNQLAEFPAIERINKKVVHDAALRKIYNDRRNELKKEYYSIVESLRTADDNFNESKEAVKILVEVVQRFRKIVLEKKFSKNALSFDDGERLALELLVDYDENGSIIQSKIARDIADYYDIIMIDEYQDSNNRQDLIFRLISKNYKSDANGNPMHGDNVFLVGDVKQSIYSFRLANPKNFIDVMKSSVPYPVKNDAKNRSILLNKNFRSCTEVIDFINFVFTEIMSEKCGDIDYNDDEKLYFGAKQYSAPHNDNRLAHFMLVDTDPSTSDDDKGEAVESPEAEVTAEKIAQMIKDEVPVIDSKGDSRPCRPSDFCILVRKKYYMNAYVKALEDRNISAKGSDEQGYLKSREIVILLDLLRIIANPLQDVPMTVVMLSPMYMFSMEELSYIKSFGNKKLIYQILIEIANDEIPDFDVKLSIRCKEFLKSVEHFRLNAVTMTTGELISSIYDTTDFVSVMQIHKDGEKKRANLRMLIQYAQNYEEFAAADGRGGLSGFIHHIDRLSKTKDGDYNQAKVSASSGDYVKVQTFHKSKGLEYPFVFICETSSKFKKSDKDTIIFNDDGRIGFTIFNKKTVRRYKTFQYKMLRNEKIRDSRSEEMRLLYVGMTRAKQRLFINLKCGDKTVDDIAKLIQKCISNGSELKNPVSQAESFSDWLWLSLMMHSEFPAIAELIGLDTENSGLPAYDTSDKLFDYEFIANTDIKKRTVDDKFIPAKADDKIVEQLKNIMNTDYDRTLSETTAKLSVTQLSKKFSETEAFDFNLQRPKFISETKNLTGAERGTAIHTFFQYCDFDNAVADVSAETERLVGLGFLTKAQAECIEPEKVMAFFESELYNRVKSAERYERERKFMVAASQLETDNPALEKFRDSDNMIKGIIDLMYEEKDGIVVVDYKSDRGISANGLKKRYMGQLKIYKSAIELITGKKVKELVIYSIELKKTIIL